ncbi:MAG: hypothetical protein WC511_01945 [Candidatus Pacearchaeota archaeon]
MKNKQPEYAYIVYVKSDNNLDFVDVILDDPVKAKQLQDITPRARTWKVKINAVTQDYSKLTYYCVHYDFVREGLSVTRESPMPPAKDYAFSDEAYRYVKIWVWATDSTSALEKASTYFEEYAEKNPTHTTVSSMISSKLIPGLEKKS